MEDCEDYMQIGYYEEDYIKFKLIAYRHGFRSVEFGIVGYSKSQRPY